MSACRAEFPHQLVMLPARRVETCFDRRRQLLRPARLAQAESRSEPNRHAQKVGRRRATTVQRNLAHGDHRHPRDRPAEPADDPQTIHLGHVDVDDRQVDGKRLEMIDTGRPAINNKHVPASLPQPCANNRANGWVVIDDEDERHSCFRWIAERQEVSPKTRFLSRLPNSGTLDTRIGAIYTMV